MIFVLGIFGIFIFYTLFFTEDRYEKEILLIPLSILTLYAGTRMDVGGYDYHVYKYFYELPYFQNPYGYEKLFVLLRDLSRFLGLSYNYFLFGLTLVFNLVIYRVLITYSIYPMLSFLIYLSTFYYWHNFTIIRNFIAILIFWISLKYILEKKALPYFTLVSIAFFFHKTAVILYPLYFLLNHRWEKKSLGILFGLALFVNPLSFLIFKIDIPFFGLSERLARYSHIIEHGSFNDFLELLTVVILVLLIRRDTSEADNLMINLNVFALLFFIAFYRFAIVLRFLEYFRLGFFIGIPFFLSKIKSRNIKYLCFIMLCIYLTGRYYNIIMAYSIDNYRSWLIK